MPTDFAFRLSLYLALGFVCVATGYAEYPILPEVSFIAAGVIVALVVIFRLETRVELLSIPAANRLGLAIGLANFTWAVYRIADELSRPELVHLNWQLMVVAIFGPLLLTLMPAKLARREKHAGDYWALHGAALVAAALAGALAEDPICFIIIGLYASCAVWNLCVFYLRRTGRSIPPVPGQELPAQFAGVVGGARGSGRLAVKFTAAGLILALPLYLITPRSPADKLELGKPRIEIGYAADQMIDLTQTGDLGRNEQVAFELTAARDGQPVTDLPADQRWRGRMLRRYSSGVWQPGDVRLPMIEPVARNQSQWNPPQLGPDQITLNFTIPATLPGFFLADPVTWAADQGSPIATATPGGWRGWLPVPDGSFLSGGRGWLGSDPFRYMQIWRAPNDADRSPVFRLNDANLDEVLRPLCNNPVPRVKEYTDGVLQELVRKGSLPTDYRDRVRLSPRPEFHDRIARALSAHLSSSPELSYTTNLRRVRKDVDPIEDFLDHSRAGHCERFATTLALMLRSQDIPTVLILGFKGCEQTDEPGRYVVRHEHAHAWVQALVPQPGQALGSRLRSGDLCCWLTLDPSPQEATGDDDQADGTWVGQLYSWVRARFKDYFVNNTPEQQQERVAAARDWLTQPAVLGSGAVLILGAFAVRSVRRRRVRVVAVVTEQQRWFDRLLRVLAAHGYQPTPGQTPREFALVVGHSLRQSDATGALAEVPLDWAEAYYETRFGGAAIPPDRLDALEAQLRELERALAT